MYSQIQSTPNPYPQIELPSELRAVVNAVHDITQAPWEMALTPLLCGISVVSQCMVKAVHPITGKHIPPSLWGFSTGESGERKSEVDKIVLAPIRRFEQQQATLEQEAQLEYAVASRLYELELTKIRARARKRSDSTLDDDLLKKQLIELERKKPKAPKLTRLLCADTTVPALLESMHQSDGRTGLFASEGGVILSGHALSQLPILNTLWDGQATNVLRKTEKPLVIPDPGLALSILVQPELMIKFLRTKDDARASGFASRGLWCTPISTQGTRFTNGYPRGASPDIEGYEQRMTDLLQESLTCESKVLLELCPGARSRWIHFYNYVEQGIGPNGRFSEIRDIASKSAEQALRISANYACYLGTGQSIGEMEMMFSVSAANFFLEQALQIFDSRFAGGYIADAAKVFNFIAGRPDNPLYGGVAMPQYELRQYGPNSLRKGPRLDIAVDYLVASNQLQKFRVGRQWWVLLRRC